MYRAPDTVLNAYARKVVADLKAGKTLAESIHWFADDEGDGKWITVNGRPVFIKDGESLQDALKGSSDKAGGADSGANHEVQKGLENFNSAKDGEFMSRGKKTPFEFPGHEWQSEFMTGDHHKNENVAVTTKHPETVSLDSLIATQEEVRGDTVKDVIQGFDRAKYGAGKDKAPIVMKGEDGKLYILDGHHRLSALKWMGRKEADVNIVHEKDLKENLKRRSHKDNSMSTTIAHFAGEDDKGNDDSDGVWRTVNGSPLFIRNGQSVADALKSRGAGGGKGKEPPGTGSDTESEGVDEAIRNWKERDLYASPNPLLTGEKPSQPKLWDKSEAEKTLRGLDKGFEDAQPLTKPRTVYIGTDREVGSVLESKGFLSSSTNPKAAGRFGDQVIEVTLPVGARVLPIKQGKDSNWKKESEILLNRGSRIRIQKDPKSNKLKGTLEVGTKKNNSIRITINGTVISQEEFVRNIVLPTLQTELSKRDASIFPTGKRKIPPYVSGDGKVQEFEPQAKKSFAAADHHLHIDYARIDRDLTQIEQRATTYMKEALVEVRDGLVKRVDRGFDSTETGPAFIKDLTLKSFKPFRTVVRGFLHDLFALGQRDLRVEAERQGKTYGLQAATKMYADPLYTPKAALQWLEAKALHISGVLEDKVLNDAQQILLNALKTGEPTLQTIGKLQQLFLPYLGDPDVLADGEELAPYRLETIVRTNSMEAYNQGRVVAARDPELEGFIRGMLYSAVLDNRTTEICKHLDGKIFPMSEPAIDNLTPPNHFNCRSLFVSVPIGVPIEDYQFVTQEDIGIALDLAGKGFT